MEAEGEFFLLVLFHLLFFLTLLSLSNPGESPAHLGSLGGLVSAPATEGHTWILGEAAAEFWVWQPNQHPFFFGLKRRIKVSDATDLHYHPNLSAPPSPTCCGCLFLVCHFFWLV